MVAGIAPTLDEAVTVDELIVKLMRVRDVGHGLLPVIFNDDGRDVDVKDVTITRLVGRDVVELSG